jgi:hypothetical protein
MVNNITNDNKQTTPQATLKLPNKQKWQLQNTDVNRRRTDNTMAKGKRQIMIYKTLHRKLKI